MTLLSRFPQFSGHSGTARLIPFLRPPQQGLTREETKIEMNRYFKELVFLPQTILESSYFTKFFSIKIGDLADTSISSDVADTLLELLDDIKSPITEKLNIQIVFEERVIEWSEEAGFDFEELIFQIKDRLRCDIQELLYFDEMNGTCPLYGDEDLRLLISSSSTLKLIVS